MDSSALGARDVYGGKHLQILPDAAILYTNVGARWNGVVMEVLRHPPLETPGHCLPGYSLTFALSSVAAEWREEGQYRSGRFAPGDFHLFTPYAPLRYVTHVEADFVQIIIPPNFLARVAEEARRSRHAELTPRYLGQDARITHIVLALKAELEAGFPTDLLFGESLTAALAVHLLRSHSTHPHTLRRTHDGLPDATLRRVTEYLHVTHAQNPTLAALAALAGMSQHHFARRFRQSTGITPHQYLIRCRIEHAQALIRQGQHSLAHIAQVVGFADQSHLTRHFRRLVGTTPARFARH